MFPMHPCKESEPFLMFHNNILGPSKVTNLTGTKWFITFLDDHFRIC